MTAISAGSWPTLLDPFHLRALPPSVLALVAAWTLVWKGLALWRAARVGHKAWFIVLLFVNTVGLLDIAYLLVVAARGSPPPSPAGPHEWSRAGVAPPGGPDARS